jgi:hypothetical protein
MVHGTHILLQRAARTRLVRRLWLNLPSTQSITHRMHRILPHQTLHITDLLCTMIVTTDFKQAPLAVSIVMHLLRHILMTTDTTVTRPTILPRPTILRSLLTRLIRTMGTHQEQEATMISTPPTRITDRAPTRKRRASTTDRTILMLLRQANPGTRRILILA